MNRDHVDRNNGALTTRQLDLQGCEIGTARVIKISLAPQPGYKSHLATREDPADTECSVPKNRPNYVDSQSHKKSL